MDLVTTIYPFSFCLSVCRYHGWNAHLMPPMSQVRFLVCLCSRLTLPYLLWSLITTSTYWIHPSSIRIRCQPPGTVLLRKPIHGSAGAPSPSSPCIPDSASAARRPGCPRNLRRGTVGYPPAPRLSSPSPSPAPLPGGLVWPPHRGPILVC